MVFYLCFQIPTPFQEWEVEGEKGVSVWFERVKGEVLFINQDSCFKNLHTKYMRLSSMTGFALSFDLVRDLPIRICSNIMKSAVGEM